MSPILETPTNQERAMQGKGNIRFSELFRSTVEEHGHVWAFVYYVCDHGMAEWEFYFWLGAA